MTSLSLVLRLFMVLLVISLHGCKSGSDSAQNPESITGQPSTAVLTQVMVTDYVVVSSRRVGRTVSEYTLRAIVSNSSSSRYTNVTATLISVPSNITVIDGDVIFGTVVGSSNTTSADELIIEVDLSISTSLTELKWQVSGTSSGTGGGGGTGSPSQTGIFMSIDGNGEIIGESTSESHQDWIVLESFSEGSSIEIGGSAGGDRASGEVNLDGVTVGKLVDSSSPTLRRALVEGDIFTEVKIDIVESCGGNIYTAYAITLTVSSLTGLIMTSAGDRPTEELSFNYSRIETMYTPVSGGCKLGIPVYSYQDAKTIE